MKLLAGHLLVMRRIVRRSAKLLVCAAHEELTKTATKKVQNSIKWMAANFDRGQGEGVIVNAGGWLALTANFRLNEILSCGRRAESQRLSRKPEFSRARVDNDHLLGAAQLFSFFSCSSI